MRSFDHIYYQREVKKKKWKLSLTPETYSLLLNGPGKASCKALRYSERKLTFWLRSGFSTFLLIVDRSDEL